MPTPYHNDINKLRELIADKKIDKGCKNLFANDLLARPLNEKKLSDYQLITNSCNSLPILRNAMNQLAYIIQHNLPLNK